MRYAIMSAVAAVAIVCGTPAFAWQAQPADTVRLTLEDARERVLTQNAAYRAALARVDVARGELRQARTLTNPVADVEALNGTAAIRSAITQELEIGGQRGARVAAAAAEVSRAEHEAADVARRLLRDAMGAFFGSMAGQERVAVMEQMLSLQNELIGAVRIQRREGEISALESNLAEVEVGRARARLLEARRMQLTDLQELRTAMALPPTTAIVLSDPVRESRPPQSADSLIATALQQRSDLAALRASVDHAARLEALAQRSRIGNPTVGVLAEREEAGTQVGVMIGIPLPLWNQNRGAIEAGRANVRRAQLELTALEVQVRNEVATAAAAYTLALEQASVMETAVVNPARENQRLLEIAYREGKTDLPTILLLRNQLMEAELDYLNARLDARAALTHLEAAIGTPLQRINDNDR